MGERGLIRRFHDSPKEAAGTLQQMESPTTRERLQLLKEEYARRLSDIDAAIEALDKNPEFENLHNLLSRISY